MAGKTEFSEDEDIVADDVGGDGDARRVHRESGVSDTPERVGKPDTYGVEGIAQRDDPQVPNALGDHQLVRRERRQDQSRDRHAPGGEDQCAEESEDERESQGTTNTGDVPPSPELGGEYRSSAAHAKLKEHHEKEDLIAQSDRANLHLSELANHEGVREVEGSHHEALQRDGQREPRHLREK
jgi:hypothetical protein